MKIQLHLTAIESEVWNWAQAASVDFWTDDNVRDDGKHFDTCPVGIASNGRATIERDSDVVDDMRYRLGEQLADMAQCAEPNDRARACRDVAIARRILQQLNRILGQ